MKVLSKREVIESFSGIKFPAAIHEKLQNVVELMEADNKIKVSNLLAVLFPGQALPSANAGLNRFIKRVSAETKSAGVPINMKITKLKKGGAENRQVWFEGKSPIPYFIEFADLSGSQPPNRINSQQAMFAPSARELETSEPCKVAPLLYHWSLDQGSRRILAFVGETGMGKTVTLKRIASLLLHRFTAKDFGLLPVYVDLSLATDINADPWSLVASLLSMGMVPDSHGQAFFDRFGFLASTPTVFIFDHLDVFLARMEYDTAFQFTQSLLRLDRQLEQIFTEKEISVIPPKIIIACRKEYFRSVKEEQAFFSITNSMPADTCQADFLEMMPLRPEESVRYLQKFPSINDTAISRIQDIHGSSGFMRRPYYLEELARYSCSIHNPGQASLTIHQGIEEDALLRDSLWHHIKYEHKMQLADCLAAYLWAHKIDKLSSLDLEDWLVHWLNSEKHLALRYAGLSKYELETDLRYATFLVRDDGPDGSHFRFVQDSFQDYFLARYLFRALEQNQPEKWEMETPNDHVLTFIVQMALKCKKRTNWPQFETPMARELAAVFSRHARAEGYSPPALFPGLTG